MIANFSKRNESIWESHICAVIWTAGCNWRCTYCNTPEYINTDDTLNTEEVLKEIKEAKDWIDGVYVTGGEPTVHNLSPLFTSIKEMGLQIKLETNGANSTVISALIEENLVDSIKMDIKDVPKKSLLKITQTGGWLYDVINSYSILSSSSIEVEYSTVLCPQYINRDKIAEVGKFLNNHGTWILTQYDNDDVLNIQKSGRMVYTDTEIKALHEIAKSHHERVVCLI
jgi:pyruvate formate lyase activating enzyme